MGILSINKAHETQRYDGLATTHGRVAAFATLCMIVLTLVELNIGEGASVFPYLRLRWL